MDKFLDRLPTTVIAGVSAVGAFVLLGWFMAKMREEV